ncbi:MAG: hypothetical protein GX339_10000 [Tissierellia bacterium]|nr:hypothetical protein [Tissierellia bacterium]
MLAELIKNGFGEDGDLNCAEKILGGANIAYNLNLDTDVMRLASGFGGGMAIEDKCGALTAAIMVLGKLFVKERARESEKIKELTRELFDDYKREMGYIDCQPLKEMYRSQELECSNVILKAAEVLDRIVMRELKYKEGE